MAPFRIPIPPGRNEDMVPRYTFAERANHWIGAFAYIYLLITGLAFWSPYLFWLAADRRRRADGAILASLVRAAFHRFAVLDVQGMAPRHADRPKTIARWGKAIPYYIENEDDKLPPQGRFNYGQKLFFWGIFYSVILLSSPESSCGKPTWFRGTCAFCAIRQS